MIVPYKWLLDYVNIDKSITEVGDELTLSGSKVEEIIENGKEISKVVTGKILSIEKHPNADRLTICRVDIKNEIIQIVTAATNIKVGDIVPVALHGSTLAGGIKIKKGKLRGVESNGMFCSEVELGIADENSVHGIMILKEGTPIGEDIKEVLGLNGGIIDFEITSNRADCFSVYGIAREAAATFKTKLKPVNTAYKSNDEDINDYLKVEVKDDLCRRYAAKMVKNVVVKDSPEWMQQRLKEAGIRPINNIVDITNFVMVELGQPMHAFDYKFIEGSKIIVRKAEDNEKFKTLDGEERTLSSSMLVIADDKKAVAVAGVMGGENSEIKNDTNTIIFECANFDGTSVRITSKKLGLRTDASSKFEKDIDPNLIDMAISRACNLIEELGAGEIVGGIVDIYKNPLTPYKLTVSASWVNKFLGTDIKPEMMKEILESLEIKTNLIGDELNLVVPTFRQDIKIREDVAEEIARIYGYNNIPTRNIVGEAVEGIVKENQKLKKIVRETMVSSGLYECTTYSFVSPKVYNKICIPDSNAIRNAVKILNPLGEDFSIMRTTAIPSMMEVMATNYSRGINEVKLFEIAKVFIPRENDELPEEADKLVIGMYGGADFYNIKGVVENLMNALGIDRCLFVKEAENPIFHPGRTAKIIIRNKEAGVLGEVHPDVTDNYDIEERVYIAEIDLNSVFEASNLNKKYKSLPKYPSVSRDIAMLVKDEVTAAEIEGIIRANGKDIMESIKLFDVYKGKQVPEGMKSIAYSITYRAEGRTLKDEEVNKVHERIVKALEEKLDAKLREC